MIQLRFRQSATTNILPMKIKSIIVFILFTLTLQATNIEQIKKFIKLGELKKAITLSDSLLLKENSNLKNNWKIDSLKQIAQRIYIDFSISEKDIDTLIEKQIGVFNQSQKANWESSKWLEFMIIDGKKMYFKRAASNLKLRLKQQLVSFNAKPPTPDSFDLFKLNYASKIIQQTKKSGELTSPQDFELEYTVTLKPNAVPAGEIVYCWLPWPKENHSRQVNLKLIDSHPKNYSIAPNNKTGQRSIHTTQKAIQDKPTIFSIKFNYTTYAQYFNPDSIICKPYNKNSELYKKYTREQLPNIVFSKPITQIADSIAKGISNPLEIVQEIYQFIASNYIWSGALEYSIIPCIPEYVIEHKKGDCGMQTFLFMSIARYKGIPVRWQSGWMLHPEKENLHDWCEVYYEGTGWVPVDMSFQYNKSSDKKIASYYVTGIDAYRMIVNDEISDRLIPAKKFLRSEPYDFQRGELEWRGGNLYFDQWNYDMKIVYKSDNEKQK